MHARCHARGFSLVELMVAVAVVAILAAIALPAYNDYVIRGKLVEAHATLADLRVKMEQWFQDNRTYLNGAACGAAMPGAAQGAKYFAYSCAATANTYTITATGNASQSLSGIAYTVNESNTKATTVAGGSTMASAGYTANASCWVTRKGGSC